MLRQTVVTRVFPPMGQIESRAMKVDLPAAVRSARNVTRDVVVADDEALDVNALDMFSIRRERERKFPVEPRRLHFDLTQLRDLLVRKIENKLGCARCIGRLIPAGL